MFRWQPKNTRGVFSGMKGYYLRYGAVLRYAFVSADF
jgi:hypothetical protein